jgi:hypothetical protein
MKIGRILRQSRLVAGVGRSVPARCQLTAATTRACRDIMLSGELHEARLFRDGALCASACVYALMGASNRVVGGGAKLLVHSALGTARGVEAVHNATRRYVVEMGIDPGLVDMAANTSPEQLRALSTLEMNRFGVQPIGDYETPWLDFRGPTGARISLEKSISTRVPNDRQNRFKTSLIRIGCVPFQQNVQFTYRTEWIEKESPIIQVEVEGGPMGDPRVSRNENSIEVTFYPTYERLKQSIDAGRFEVAEQTMDRSVLRVLRFSTAGFSPAANELQSQCALPLTSIPGTVAPFAPKVPKSFTQGKRN